MEATIQSINLISTDPNIRNGRPCIAGASIEVSVIVVAKIVQGLEPDEIAADYDLSLSQVYAALAYYYENKQAIDASISERRQLAQKMKEDRVGSRHINRNAKSASRGGAMMAHSSVADLTIDEFKDLIKEVVSQTILEMLGDPDEGLELRDEIRDRLRRSLAATPTFDFLDDPEEDIYSVTDGEPFRNEV